MILKTAANYNDEGGYIEAWKNSDGTTEVKLIPKSGGGGGGDEGKQGLKSISISPAIQTTPAIDSLAPIYYDDLTEEQKQDGVHISSNVESGVLKSGDTYQFSITPTADWYVYDMYSHTFGNKGEPYTIQVTAEDDNLGITFVCASDNVMADNTKSVPVIITVSAAQ